MCIRDSNFKDPDSRHGKQTDPVSGCEYHHRCTGQNGFIQRALIDASRRGGGRRGAVPERESDRTRWRDYQDLAGSANEVLFVLARRMHE
eukprot:4313274-Alexandrium_andersonii.AAC.1